MLLRITVAAPVAAEGQRSIRVTGAAGAAAHVLECGQPGALKLVLRYGAQVQVASYDARLLEGARKLRIPIMPL